MQTTSVNRVSAAHKKRNAILIGGGAGLGAAIGAIAGGGKGALIGAGQVRVREPSVRVSPVNAR